MAIGDKDNLISTLQADKDRLASIIREKDDVIAKKERLIQEYKSDIEKERREKAEMDKKNKQLQHTIDENKYVL